MPANGTYLICLTAATLVLLLFLILVVKLHAFVALLISAMAMGLASGMPPDKVLKSIQTGFGDALAGGFLLAATRRECPSLDDRNPGWHASAI